MKENLRKNNNNNNNRLFKIFKLITHCVHKIKLCYIFYVNENKFI